LLATWHCCLSVAHDATAVVGCLLPLLVKHWYSCDIITSWVAIFIAKPNLLNHCNDDAIATCCHWLIVVFSFYFSQLPPADSYLSFKNLISPDAISCSLCGNSCHEAMDPCVSLLMMPLLFWYGYLSLSSIAPKNWLSLLHITTNRLSFWIIIAVSIINVVHTALPLILLMPSHATNNSCWNKAASASPNAITHCASTAAETLLPHAIAINPAVASCLCHHPSLPIDWLISGVSNYQVLHCWFSCHCYSLFGFLMLSLKQHLLQALPLTVPSLTGWQQLLQGWCHKPTMLLPSTCITVLLQFPVSVGCLCNTMWCCCHQHCVAVAMVTTRDLVVKMVWPNDPIEFVL